MFIHGIELYLSEPVICDDQFIGSLFGLWRLLQVLEVTRLTLKHTVARQEPSPAIAQAMEIALSTATKLSEAVDMTLAKMNPLGGS